MNLQASEIRFQFPHTRELIYVNHAAISPLSTRVRAALDAYVADRHDGRIENFETFEAVIEETRERVGRLFGAPAHLVEFAPNTSYALNVLAHGLDWQPGDRIAVPGCEFPANVYPFLHLRSKGVEVDFIPHRDGVFDADDVRRTLTNRTRLVSVSWVQFLSGFRADLAKMGALCREHGVWFCVDAIQGLGALEFGDAEAMGVDFIASGCHKWLMGLEGLGFLYVSERLFKALTPPMAGWLHGPVDWDDFFDYRLEFHDDARRFRLGMLNMPGIAALHAALGLYFETGLRTCHDRVLSRSAALREGFGDRELMLFGTHDSASASGIVTIRHPNATGLFAHLERNHIRASLRNGMLRFAPTWYNSEEEMERILEVVDGFG